MANYNIHFSPTGGTKKVADALCQRLTGNFTEIDLCKEPAPMTFSEADLCVVSVPSYGGRVPSTAIDRLKKLRGNAKAVLVCVYGNREWEDTLTELQDTLEECGMICVAAVAAVAEHSIFRQFAAARPDGEDLQELSAFAESIQEKLNGGKFDTLQLAGNHGTYKEYGGVPFKPIANDSCGSCGLCAESCPVGAIPQDNPRTTDADVCISCMRCVQLCPTHARDFDAAFMAERTAKMEALLSGRKANHLFL